MPSVCEACGGAFSLDAERELIGEYDEIEMALSRCRTKITTRLRLVSFQAAATAARHVFIAAARKLRRVRADVRWRWTLKML